MILIRFSLRFYFIFTSSRLLRYTYTLFVRTKQVDFSYRDRRYIYELFKVHTLKSICYETHPSLFPPPPSATLMEKKNENQACKGSTSCGRPCMATIINITTMKPSANSHFAFQPFYGFKLSTSQKSP